MQDLLAAEEGRFEDHRLFHRGILNRLEESNAYIKGGVDAQEDEFKQLVGAQGPPMEQLEKEGLWEEYMDVYYEKFVLNIIVELMDVLHANN